MQPYHTLKGSRSLLPSLFKVCGHLRRTVLVLQQARPGFHRFSIKLSLKNDHIGASAGQAQISLFFNQVLIKESPFWGSSWPGPDFTDFQLNCLKNNYFRAPADQAQISLIFNQIPIKD